MVGPPTSPSIPPSILSTDLSPLSSPPSDLSPISKWPSFWVDLPKLAAGALSQYKRPQETSLSYTVDEIIGEYAEGPRLWYFARYKKGIAYKFPSIELSEDFPELVEQYEERKAAGTLQPFDPSGHYVHPKSRIKVVLHIKPKRKAARSILSESDYLGTATEDQEMEDSWDEYGGSKTRSGKERQRRSQHVATRSRAIVSDSDADEVAELDISPSLLEQSGTRRSRRSRLTRHPSALHGSARSDPEYTRKKLAAKPRKKLKPARPAYGYVRSIEDLEAIDDDEMAILKNHRDVCEKCRQPPAHALLEDIKKQNKNKKRKRRQSAEDDFEESEEERASSLGGWIRCLSCPVSAHWRCLGASQRQEIIKAVKDRFEKSVEQPEPLESMQIGSKLEVNQTTDFICGHCAKGGFCMSCKETVLKPEVALDLSQNVEPGKEGGLDHDNPTQLTQRSTLFFRCVTCKRLAHYEHLPNADGFPDECEVVEKARYYQRTTDWLCADCASYQHPLDKIIAWRPYPLDAIEIPYPDTVSLYKQPLPREYLVKWQGRGYRRAEWVPHMWLLNTYGMKLKNFLTGGSKVELVPHSVDDDMLGDDVSEVISTSRASSVKPGTSTPSPVAAMPDAESRIPIIWKTVDRVLDVRLWRSPADQKKKQATLSEAEEESYEELRRRIYDLGEEPPTRLMERASGYKTRTGTKISHEDADKVIWAFIKWGELGYEEATWDSPPRESDPGYPAFKSAFQRYLDSLQVSVPKMKEPIAQAFDNRRKEEYKQKHVLRDASDLDLGQDPKLKLMNFQVDGFNWLSNNWWTHQHCILADEMGLGKTVQIAAFLGNLVQNWKAAPALVVVPNSTITNWVREVQRWAPNLRVVPFYGETKAREVIKQYELFHEKPRPGDTPAKFHVLITTYEAVLNAKDFYIFKSQPRWEVLIVDEGQRLKNDSSLLFRKLNELKSIHRIIMTGTPLNNNMRELFNLMNFLDPVEWRDLAGLEKEYEELTEDLVKQLHQRLRPYFLRRVKSEVLQLPPKNEVIVPVTMTKLQKKVYKSLITRNLNVIKGLTRPATSKNANTAKGQINNLLMQLRKILQHPYLYNEDIEPRNLPPKETHEKLVDGSAKLRLLRGLLPKLKGRGHRILLFSQFAIALDIVEDFLRGEGYKYLRLDGSTKNADRQKGMDEFNKPGSDVFIYLLTTRAGGVGINLFSADTVIIFDPDFNPHQDLQAIARAYRYGQQKTCLVFKLMVKESAEERIMQIGKKKLVLDHLIVQKMDDEENTSSNMESILTYGAQALFESAEDSEREINYSEHDLEKLVEKTEAEGEQASEAPQEGAMAFTFAKIWSADKDTMEEVEDNDQADSWAQTLKTITAEHQKAQEREIAESGRGARRKAAVLAQSNIRNTGGPTEDSPTKTATKKLALQIDSDGSSYAGSRHGSDSGDSVSEPGSPLPESFGFEERDNKRQRMENWSDSNQAAPHKGKMPAARQNDSMMVDSETCAMCGKLHDDSDGCIMTESSENLAEYREMLILNGDDEPWEERYAAIRVIDETLYNRGHISLIVGQPLRPLRKTEPGPMAKVPSRQKNRVG